MNQDDFARLAEQAEEEVKKLAADAWREFTGPEIERRHLLRYGSLTPEHWARMEAIHGQDGARAYREEMDLLRKKYSGGA
jgi:hypothetical protein